MAHCFVRETTDFFVIDPSTDATHHVDGSSSDVGSEPTEILPEPSRIRFREHHWNRGNPTTTDVGGSQERPAPKVKENADYAFTWTRCFDNNEIYEFTDLEIQPGPLAVVLKDNLGHDPNFPHHDTLISFRSPFKCIVHNWTKLQAIAVQLPVADDGQSRAGKDLQQLLKHVRDSTDLAPYFQDFDPVKEPKTINWQFLWTIFPPGCLIYSKPVMGKDQVLLFQYADEEELENSNKKMFILTCSVYDWNGETFNRVPYELTLEFFSDTKSINTLDHYPLKYHRNADEVRSRLINRGKRYRELCVSKSGAQMFDYNGISIEDQKGITRQDVNGRVGWTIAYCSLTTKSVITDGGPKASSERSSVVGASGWRRNPERKTSPKVTMSSSA